MNLIHASIKVIFSVTVLSIISGCSTPPAPYGKIMVNRESIIPIQSLSVVYAFPKAQEWIRSKEVRVALESKRYFEGGFDKLVAQKWQQNFAANGVSSSYQILEKPYALAEMLPVDESASHSLIINSDEFTAIFNSGQGTIVHLGTSVQLFDHRAKKVVWTSGIRFRVGPWDIDDTLIDESFLVMLNSWAENGIVKLNTKFAKTAQGKSRKSFFLHGMLVE